MAEEYNGTCGYTARKDDPSNWHGEGPDDWVLDQDVWECPHDALEGKEFCAFHTEPEELSDDIDEGEMFLEAVKEASAVDDEETARRKKEFVGAKFGSFNIEGATLDAGYEYRIHLDHAVFNAGICADNTVINHGLRAAGTRFETGDEFVDEIGAVSFANADFTGDGDISFGGAEFNGDGDISFRDAEFSGDGNISFGGAEFSGDGDILFNLVDFTGDGQISFWAADFSGDGEISFTNAKFSGDRNLQFDSAEFRGNGKISFWDADFFGAWSLSFRKADFLGDGTLTFRFAEFSGDGKISFEKAEFSGDGYLSFWDAEFNGDVDLSFNKSEINRECTFMNVHFSAEKSVTFIGAEIESLMTFEQESGDSPRELPGNLDFSNATFHDELRFQSSEQSSTNRKDSDRLKPMFEVIFTDSADFTGTTFHNDVDFSATCFPSDVDFTEANLQGADFSGADVTGTGEISKASFDGADLTDVDFSGANLRGASFERARLSRAELLGANFAGTKLYGALLGDARVNRETTFWLPGDADHNEPDTGRLRLVRRVKDTLRRGPGPYCVYDPRYQGTDGEPNLEKAAEVYGSLETVARQNSLPKLASECFLGRKDVQIREYWQDGDAWMVARSVVPNLVARYGESPLRVLSTGAFTILICGVLYEAFDLIESTNPGDTVSLFDSLYFSALTFTTLGYGDYNPTNSIGQILAVAETSIGVILLAILVFVFGRRATR